MSIITNPPLINLEHVIFSYSEDPSLRVLDIPSWTVSAGEHVFVVGSSGSGKSTLLKILSGLLTANSGAISIAEHHLENMSDKQRDRFRATELGYVAQSFNLIPYLSAVENIHLANHFGRALIKADRNKIDIESLLLKLNITQAHWHKAVEQLSVGQQQRVAIARAIANKPALLIADEPTSSLDQTNRDTFMSMLMTMAEAHNMTLVFVSHDLSLSHYFHRIDSMSEINKAGG